MGAKRAQPEAALQRTCVAWLELLERQGKLAFFAVPNGAHLAGRNDSERALKANRLKAEGMRSGVPDLCIVLPNGRCGWIEMKAKGGSLSETQKAWRDELQRLGHPWTTAKSLETVQEFVGELLG